MLTFIVFAAKQCVVLPATRIIAENHPLLTHSRMSTSQKCACNPSEMNTYSVVEALLKTRDFKPFVFRTYRTIACKPRRIRTYKNRVGGRVRLARQIAASLRPEQRCRTAGGTPKGSLDSARWPRMTSMRVRLLTFAALLLAALLPASPTSAQAPPPAVIAEIHASGSRHYTEAQIVALSGLKPGAPITREHLQAVANYLAQLGIFSRVNYRFTTRDADTNLEFQVEDAPLVRVWFDNFPWFSEEELMSAIRQAVPLFDGVAPQDGSLLDDISSALTLLLETQKISGTIERTLVARPGSDDMIMQFRVVGPALTIGSVAYSDALAQNSPKLRDRNLDLVGKPFSRFAIEMFITEQVRPLYVSSGHLRAQFGAPQPRFTGDPNLPLPSQVSVTLPIEPGPAYKLREVTWSGNTILNRGPLDSLVIVKRGEIADGMALAGIWQRVAREYARRGYLDAKVHPQPEYSDADGTVDFRVALDEGPQYRMGRLVITGLSLDAERALRAAWKLVPGDVLDGAYVEDMLAKLEKPTPDIFGRLPLRYSEVGHLLSPGEAANTMDVMIDFQR